MVDVVALRSGVVVAILLIALAFALKDVFPGRKGPAVRLRVPDDAPRTLLATRGGDLYRIGAATEPRVRLTKGRGAQSPEWSPDATRIVFSKDSHIWVLETRSRRAAPLTAGPGIDGAPTWSPDGPRVAFQRTVGFAGSGMIWTVNADGSGLTRIPASEGLEQPACAPRLASPERRASTPRGG